MKWIKYLLVVLFGNGIIQKNLGLQQCFDTKLTFHEVIILENAKHE